MSSGVGIRIHVFKHTRGSISKKMIKFISIVHPLTPLSSPSAKSDAGESEGPLESYPRCRGCLIREPYERVVSRYVPRSRFPPSCQFRCVSSRTHSRIRARACIVCRGERMKRKRVREREREKGRSTDHHPGTGCISLYLWARW